MAEKKTTKAAVKAEDTAIVAETAAAKKTTEKKAGTKKETTKKETATVTKKAPAKKVACELHVQFAGKSYSQEELVKMAKDVWRYDLKQKVGDLKDIELYVKPEENAVYYVMNKEFTGNFYI